MERFVTGFGVFFGIIALVVAGTTVMGALGSSNETSTAQEETIAGPSAAAVEESMAQTTSLLEAPKPDIEPSPAAAEPAFQPYHRYVSYDLVTQEGTLVAGADFEAAVMCRDVYEAAEENMWALRHLVVVGTQPGMTTFLGSIEGRPVEVSLFLENRRPILLALGGETVGGCAA